MLDNSQGSKAGSKIESFRAEDTASCRWTAAYDKAITVCATKKKKKKKKTKFFPAGRSFKQQYKKCERVNLGTQAATLKGASIAPARQRRPGGPAIR